MEWRIIIRPNDGRIEFSIGIVEATREELSVQLSKLGRRYRASFNQLTDNFGIVTITRGH